MTLFIFVVNFKTKKKNHDGIKEVAKVEGLYPLLLLMNSVTKKSCYKLVLTSIFDGPAHSFIIFSCGLSIFILKSFSLCLQ
ncbi:hypothetical protein VIGAN_11031900 [Vigna angularis var. angularis]|uniref:Uncharacterized protein n=1 Tax=Vigna angularis var. angularis TaxID=157739 RepID=A0A0S3T7F8_PHAAN|nr:hypothetical protein VIGAN_11031900 [Vigna angularis var. angularis]